MFYEVKTDLKKKKEKNSFNNHFFKRKFTSFSN
jgi:hypothetical protein